MSHMGLMCGQAAEGHDRGGRVSSKVGGKGLTPAGGAREKEVSSPGTSPFKVPGDLQLSPDFSERPPAFPLGGFLGSTTPHGFRSGHSSLRHSASSAVDSVRIR